MDQIISPDDYFGMTGSQRRQVWHFDGATAVRVGVVNPDRGSKVTLAPGQTLRDALSTVFANDEFVLHRMALPPGAYYRRIARPIDQHPLQSPGTSPDLRNGPDLLVGSLNQVRSLVEMLDTIFQTVQPVEFNMNCFGTTIRNLVILGCTECEAQWRGVMTANGYERPRNTADYVKLLPAMRLSEYEVKLQHSPWLPGIAPFRGWNASAPTYSIAWYDDYNAAKHDRIASFERASLRSALQAVVAVWIMIAAQYGTAGTREFSDLDRYFSFVRVPLWRYSEVYTHGYQGTDGVAGPRNFPF